MRKHLLILVALCSLAGFPADGNAQPVYRCGNVYTNKPADGCALVPEGKITVVPGRCTSPIFAANPMVLAKVLLPQFERLYEAIPTLSPREEQWLDNEMNRLDAVRWKRANDSRENSIWRAKLDAGDLLGTIRVLSKAVVPQLPERPVVVWTHLASALIDDDGSLHLARLEAMGIIKSDSLPQHWTMWGTTGRPLRESIQDVRVMLAKHILTCIVPAVAD